MSKTPATAPLSEPVELKTKDTEHSPRNMSAKDKANLEDELGIKRRFVHVKDEGRIEIGEGPYFDDLCLDDPTGQKAREAFGWTALPIELGEQADRIMVDAKIYFHGGVYHIRNHQYPTFMEIAYRSRRHDAEVQGQSKGLLNSKKNFAIGKGGVPVAGAGASK